MILTAALYLSGLTSCLRKDNFAYYGSIPSQIHGHAYSEAKRLLGSPDSYERIDYNECFDSLGRRIAPLHNRYLNHLNRLFARAKWNNVENSGESITLYLQIRDTEENEDTIVFWGIRCAPEQTDSVLNLFVEKEMKHK